MGRWISGTKTSVKEWVAIGGLFVLLLIGFIVVSKIILNIIRTQQRTNLIARQTMLAVCSDPQQEAYLNMIAMTSSDPQQEAWLSMMER